MAPRGHSGDSAAVVATLPGDTVGVACTAYGDKKGEPVGSPVPRMR